MLTLLTSVLAPTATPILLLAFVCPPEESSPVAARYELTIAAGMARSRMVSPATQAITNEATKILSRAELAELRRNIACIPAPFSNYCASRIGCASCASLRLVVGEQAWNVTLAPSDRQWEEFHPLLRWIEEIHETRELRRVRPRTGLRA